MTKAGEIVEHSELWERLAVAGAAEHVDTALVQSIRNELFELHYWLLVATAKKQFQKCAGCVELDELISAGVDGMIASIERFDYTRNLKFATYAQIRIRGAMLDYLRSASVNKRSFHSRAKMVAEFQQSTGHRVNDDEVYEHFGFTIRDNTPSSLDAPSGERKTVADTLRGFSRVGSGLEDCTYLLSGLNRRERLAVLLYYFEGYTMKEVATELAISESRVSQMFTALLPRMRENFERAAA